MDGSIRLAQSIILLLRLSLASGEFELGGDVFVVRHLDVDFFVGILRFLDFLFELLQVDLRRVLFFPEICSVSSVILTSISLSVSFSTTVIFLPSTSTLERTPSNSSASTDATTKPIATKQAVNVMKSFRRVCMGACPPEDKQTDAQPWATGLSIRKSQQGGPSSSWERIIINPGLARK